MGFMSRMLPVSYDYGVNAQIDIHHSIARREYLGTGTIRLDLPKEDLEVSLELAEAEELVNLTALLKGLNAKNSPESVYGFRLQKQLQRLAMANAIRDKRDIVTQSDVDYIRSLASCINLEYYPI